MSVEATYQASGLTCSHCASSVQEEISEIAGVTSVNVDVVKGGSSTIKVVSEHPLALSDVESAVQEAGYALNHPGNLL